MAKGKYVRPYNEKCRYFVNGFCRYPGEANAYGIAPCPYTTTEMSMCPFSEPSKKIEYKPKSEKYTPPEYLQNVVID